jgi:hypothetical protein
MLMNKHRLMKSFPDVIHRQMGQYVLSSNDAIYAACTQPHTKLIM